MNAKFLKFLWAAFVVALVGCGESSTEPPPDLTPLSVSVLAPSGRVNETVPLETPIEFLADIRGASPSAQVTWREGGEVICRGNPCSAVPLEGTHPFTVEVIDGERRKTASGSYTVRPRSLVLQNFLPNPGTVVLQGESLVCRAEVSQVPDRGEEFADEVWQMDGGDPPIICEDLGSGEKEVVTSSSPVSGAVSLGEHQLSYRRCLTRYPDTCVTYEVTVVVRPEPSYITYTAVYGSSRDFYRLDLWTGEVEELTTDGNRQKYWPEISPDGTKLAFVRSREPCNGILVIQNLDGSGEVEIGEGPTWEECGLKGLRSPRWSPDGKSVAVIGGDETAPGAYRVSVVTVATREVKHLLLRTCSVSYSQPAPCVIGGALEVAWSSDGWSIYTTLAEHLGNGEVQTHVVQVRLNPLTVTRLYTDATNNSSDFLGPSVYDISRDGGTLSLHIRYSALGSETPRLALLGTGGGELQFITPSGAGNPDWPTFCEVDGEEHVFYVNKSRQNELRRVRKDGTGDQVFYTASHDIETHRCQDSPS